MAAPQAHISPVQKAQGQKQSRTFDELKASSMDMGATGYMECSALKQTGLQEVFDECIRAALKHKASGVGADRGAGGSKPVKKSTKSSGCVLL